MNATSYQWIFAGANPGVSTDVNPTGICYGTPGTYSVTLIAFNSNGSDTLTLNNFITVYPYPAPQGILQSGDTLFANPGATSYQWFYGGNSIPGATDYFYVATQSGDYNVVATDANGCEVEAAIFDVVAEIPLATGSSQFAIYPNPVIEKLIIHKSQFTSETVVKISIFNMIGEKMRSDEQSILNNTQQIEIDVAGLAGGMYWIQLTTPGKTFRSKFIKSNGR